MIEHPFAPVFDSVSEILILGTFPSVKSRENEFYYGHPQNRFWKVLAKIFNSPVPVSIEEKKVFLLKNKVAVWDTIKSCQIIGSSDSSISEVVPNDISWILSKAPIKKIFCNGTKAFDLYQKYIFPVTKVEAIKLPSTSPANAAWGLERLVDEWGKMIK